MINKYTNMERDTNGKYIKGHEVSEDIRKRLRLFNLGKKHSEQTRKKIGLIRLGKHLSPETKDKISKAHKIRFANNPELREQRRQQTKRLMLEGKIKGLQKGELNVAKRPEVRKILSEKTTLQMKLHPNKSTLGTHRLQTTKDKISKANKGMKAWNKGIPMSDETKKKMVETRMKNGGYTHREETKNKMRLSYLNNPNSGMKGKRHTPEAIIKVKEARSRQVLPLNDTTIEVKIQNYLKQLGIEFYTHSWIGNIEHRYQCDILIPSMNLVIECDGTYWHRYPIGRDIDRIRTSELIQVGFKVLRLWEHEIKVMSIQGFQDKLNEVNQ